MNALLSQISFIGHAATAFCFAALAVWQIHRLNGSSNRQQLTLIGALFITSIWALLTAFYTPYDVLSSVSEVARNLGWLLFMYILLRAGGGHDSVKQVRLIYAVLLIVSLFTLAADVVAASFASSPRVLEIFFFTCLVLRMIITVGSLVLVHNLYTVSAPENRWGIRLPMAALTAMWTYDLNIYTIAYLSQQLPAELLGMRGIAMLGLIPVFALGAVRNRGWKLHLSRSVAFQSFSLFAIGAYLIAMVLVANAVQIIGGDYARFAQISLVFGMSVAALLLLPSAKFRAWFKVKVAKHFFQHRYDYRSEWMRFTDTLGLPGEGAAPFHERVIQAMADITESPAGLLLLPDEHAKLQLQARWNWSTADVPARACTPTTISFFQQSGHIVELDTLRTGEDDQVDDASVPAWMIGEANAWTVIPLIHFDRLAGLVVLARPRVARTLDWEDLDMLRVAGRQAASYLAESRGQEALSEARRFDEFNRRFAFIMHDIKNLVSQLSLLSRNAERHADNPEFRTDMIETLQSSVGKMNDLLARLSQHNKAKASDPVPVKIGSILESVVQSKRMLHAIEITAMADLTVIADRSRVEQILGHLAQNAIDASISNQPVYIKLYQSGLSAAVEILDYGEGMSSEFVRSELFRPFSSSKEGGFGVGAYEAQSLAHAMNGRIEVESREGEGSRFTLLLPLAQIETDKLDEEAA